MSRRSLLLVPCLVSIVAGAACVESEEATLSTHEALLQIVPRGTTCRALDLGNQQVTLPDTAAGVYALDARSSLRITYYEGQDVEFYFHQSTLRITGVLVSNGDRTLAWDLPGGADAWPSLHGPFHPDTGEYHAPEEIAFCFDYALRVQPSPYTYHARRPSWSIERASPTGSLVVEGGETASASHTVTVRPGAIVPSGQFVDGPVFVHNESPLSIAVGSVTTQVGELAATVTCPGGASFTMAPYTTVECAFHAEVPDTGDRVVRGSATPSHWLRVTGQAVTASFAAANTATITIDDCVAVTDTMAPYTDGFLAAVCVDDGDTTLAFTASLGALGCGPFALEGTARWRGLDTGASGTASSTVTGEVECGPGCTRGADWWRAHSLAGGAGYDLTWASIGPAGERTAFFRSGTTWIGALSQPTLLNPYWPLARAYIAARLNQLAPVEVPAVTAAAMADAAAMLTSHTPTQMLLDLFLRPRIDAAIRALEDYNQGRVGPGACP